MSDTRTKALKKELQRLRTQLEGTQRELSNVRVTCDTVKGELEVLKAMRQRQRQPPPPPVPAKYGVETTYPFGDGRTAYLFQSGGSTPNKGKASVFYQIADAQAAVDEYNRLLDGLYTAKVIVL